ncbi:MAG TPA: fluoride efflux transporter CrcB [Gammaproteobacteria bacterium]|nr:fluoride efflux transporter CrcB [Gammaproteobacteria bacterium]
MQVIAIALGGAGGAVLRFWTSTAVYSMLGRDFPWGTLVVNVLGSLLMGFLSVMLVERMTVGPEWRAAILVGFLGAFTTFSTFSLETLNLLEAGALFRALLNIGSSVLLCVTAAGMGLLIGRQL